MKELKVIKRDGRIVDFDKSKIVIAIMKAFKSADQKLVEEDENFKPDKDYELIKAGNIAEYIKNYVESIDYNIDIETIQDMVEKGLMSNKRKDVAKAYILYREERSKIRTKKSKLITEIGKKLRADDVQNQNANVDEYSFGGRKGEAANEMARQYALDYIMSPMARDNHLNNEIYTHDLDNYALGMHNCLSIPYDDLLKNGFNTRQTDVRPANSVNTACQLIAVIFQLQSLVQFGGCSATHLDWTLIPYIRKSFYKHYKDGLKYIKHIEDIFEFDENESIESNRYKEDNESYQYAIDKTEKELTQAIEGLYHNLNTLQSRSGDQLNYVA